MDVRELRLGNLFEDQKGRICDVTRIAISFDECEIMAVHWPLTTLPVQPIQLTDEWYIKLGIQKPNNDFRQVDFCGHYCDLMDTGFMYQDTHIKYVHEAQNIYYWNSGKKELEWK